MRTLAFEPPILLPNAGGGHLTQWTDGFFGFSDSMHALGKVDSKFFASSDSGRTWSQLWSTAMAQEAADDTVDLVPSEDGRSFFNLANISNQGDGARNKRNLTSLHANLTTRFSLTPAGLFTKEVETVSLSFNGIPHPGVREFRTFGADRIRLADRTLLSTVIVNGGAFEYGGHASIIAFRSDDGFRRMQTPRPVTPDVILSLPHDLRMDYFPTLSSHHSNPLPNLTTTPVGISPGSWQITRP